jgi:aromatic-L-amino-acid/L-tryptophan decarboxylase
MTEVMSGTEFRRLGYQAVDIAADYLTGVAEHPVFQRMTESQREAIINMPMSESPLSGDEILQQAARRILPHAMGNGHPRFFGWVNSPPAPMAVITEILAAAMNPSCAGGDHAAIYLEHCVLRWMQQLLGFPLDGSGGLLVSGGSAASLTALAAARHRALRDLKIDVRKQGVSNADGKLRLYASTQVHSCVQKAVELLGLGSDCIRWIGVDDEFRISLDELRRAIDDDRRQGLHPFCIVASAGSVHTGAIDPLNELADIARESGLWLHVDGAYGAAAILDPDAKILLAGIERADSIALDPHKWLSVPVECGCVLVRDAALLRETFSLVPSYIRTDPGKGIGNLPWFSEFGIQQTRGFRALKLWVTLAHAGMSGLQRQIGHQIALARYLEHRIEQASDFELLSKGKLSIVCFRYLPPQLAEADEALDDLNKKIMEQVQADGAAFITSTILNNSKLANRFALRACILHYATTESDIDALLETIRTTAPRIAT